MDSDIAIRVEGLGKKYVIGHQIAERGGTLREALVRGASNFARMGKAMLSGAPMVTGDEVEDFWALRHVNFEIKRGDVVGIIGRNGAGKSTLLKVLSRITEPTTGRVQINGRVASLLEVGTGFHPELSGRENIYLNGAILGMTRAEIRRQFDEIVAFAEIEKFLDTPVKRYSSGMYVRLAFAVAAHLDPEILIIDEVLAVGDAEFQKKCLGKMQDVAGAGRTVLFVSHNMAAMQALCNQGMLLESGHIREHSSVNDAIRRYLTQATQAASVQVTATIRLTHIQLSAMPGSPIGSHRFQLNLDLTRRQRISDLAILIYSDTGVRIAVADLRDQLALPVFLDFGQTFIEGEITLLDLVEISYDIGIYICSDTDSGVQLAVRQYTPSPPINNPRSYPAQHLGYIRPAVGNVTVQSPARDLREAR